MIELSDMTNEELIKESNIFHSNFLLAGTDGKELFETQAELLSRLEQGENLKCCGNCASYETRQCFNYAVYVKTGVWQQVEKYCDKWQSDGMKQAERIIK